MKEGLSQENVEQTNKVVEGDGKLHIMSLIFAVGEGQRERRDGLSVVGEEARHLRRLVYADAIMAVHICWRLQENKIIMTALCYFETGTMTVKETVKHRTAAER